jgi:hypothetical protein
MLSSLSYYFIMSIAASLLWPVSVVQSQAEVRSGVCEHALQVGIVSIPGMMTGQILSGSDPSQACRS